jgi:hypothetical protein
LPWSGGFNDTTGIAFSGHQNEMLLNGTMYDSAKGLMTLGESHFQPTKRPKRGFVDARYLCVEGFMTKEESHF